MHRLALTFLERDWLSSPNRKPLILRGARQVGKTWLVRHLAEMTEKKLIEVNFEKTPALQSLFSSNDPGKILLNLSATLNQEINPSTCLLFLDEIQAAPELFAKLRWFAEDLPQLPTIAAGSLLEFVLEKHTFSMPVGRINYMHLEPLSFEEFLLALEKKPLLDFIKAFQFGDEIPLIIHDQLMSHFKEYMVVGGMPAAVSSWVSQKSLMHVSQIHADLLATYRDDFAKYSGRLSIDKLDEVLMSIPKSLGQKFMYSKVNPALKSESVKQMLSLLNKARLCYRVSGCAANGVPLRAEVKEKYFKEIFLDVGLSNAALGLNFNQITSEKEITFINKGGIAEQAAGQLLRTIDPFYQEPTLFYWQRDTPGSNAEIDYVIQHGGKVIPIEVKAGATGTLKSLHLFMELKKLDVAIRINSDLPSKTKMDYTLLSIPFYMISEIHRLVSI